MCIDGGVNTQERRGGGGVFVFVFVFGKILVHYPCDQIEKRSKRKIIFMDGWSGHREEGLGGIRYLYYLI